MNHPGTLRKIYEKGHIFGSFKSAQWEYADMFLLYTQSDIEIKDLSKWKISPYVIGVNNIHLVRAIYKTRREAIEAIDNYLESKVRK